MDTVDSVRLNETAEYKRLKEWKRGTNYGKISGRKL